MRTQGVAAAFTLWLVSLSWAHDPSTIVLPSEDEILQALQLGEIDSTQYLVLQEIIVHGIDSTNLHLLDEIPNLSFFLTQPNSLTTSLETEQMAPFTNAAARMGALGGFFKHQYYQEMEEQGRSQYRSSGHVIFNNNFDVAFKLHREFTGRERFVSRRLTYRGPGGNMRKITLGNFSARLGLGTIFGYRGKLLEFSDRINNESFLFPDYGGYNGAHTQVRFNRVDIEALGSVNRDAHHTLTSVGGMVSLNGGRWQPALIFGANRLKNRATNEHLTDVKYGLASTYRYDRGYLSFELAAQAGERESWGCLVAEGRHRFGEAEIKYAGWTYSDHYLDLTGGGKAGNLHRQITFDDIDFAFSDKRSGQEGGLLRSVVLLIQKLEMVNSLSYAGRNRDTADFQLLSGLVMELSSLFEARLDYLVKSKRRRPSAGERDALDQQTRLEVRIKTGELAARSYIAYNTKSGSSDNAALFFNVRYRLVRGGVVELWSHLARIDVNDKAIDYWYSYVKSEQFLFHSVTVGAKVSHRYSRTSEEKHNTVVSLEVSTAL